MIEQIERLTLTSQDYLFTQINDSEIPSQFKDTSNIQRHDSMKIQNFKSFDQKYVGPFLNFTCIIGPNGSGKSNILDALMFCFCSENSRLSLLDARELINRQGKQSFKELSKQNKVCSVEATFILKNERKFTISRSLDAEGKEEYLVDFESVSKKVYQNILIRKGINTNTPNYAIWQGEIDRLILKDPVQLTGLFENLSGSIYLKKLYDETKENLQKIQTEMEDKNRKMNKLKIDKKNLKVAKQTNDEYNKYDNQYQEVMKKIYFLQVLEKERAIEELQDECKIAFEQEEKKKAEIENIKKEGQKKYFEKTKLQQEMNEIMLSLEQNYSKLKEIDSHGDLIKRQNLKYIIEEFNKQENEYRSLQEEKLILKSSVEDNLNNELIEEYLKAYQLWEEQNSELHREMQKKNTEMLYTEGLLSTKNELKRDLEIRITKFRERKNNKAQNLKDLKEDKNKISKSIAEMENEEAGLQTAIAKNKIEHDKKLRNFEEICSSIEDLEKIIDEQAQDEKEGELLKSLASIDGFHGALHQKIKPNAIKYDVCFSIIFSTVRKYLLCQSEDASKKIGIRLREMRSIKNLIILDNVPQKRTNDIRKSLGKDGQMGIDIVEFDNDTKGLKDYLNEFLHGKVICETLAIAYKIRNKSIEGVQEIYTLDGNVIKMDGSISTHGNIDSIKKTSKFSNGNTKLIYQEISKLVKEKEKQESELKNMEIKFSQKEAIKHKSELDQLRKNLQTITFKISEIENNQEKEPSLPQSIANEIRELEIKKENINNKLNKIDEEIKNSKVFDKFIKKHKIDNLEIFRKVNNTDYLEKEMKRKAEVAKELIQIEGKLKKLEKSLVDKKMKKESLEEEILNAPGGSDRGTIEARIAENERDLIDIRNKISGLTSIHPNKISFQSTLITLEAKLKYAQQKIKQDLEELSYDLGVEFLYPIEYEEIQKVLNLPKKVTDKSLESLSEKLEEERLKIEQHLDKHNSINLIYNMEEDEEKIEKGMNNTLEEVKMIIEERKKLTDELESIRKERTTILTNFVNELKEHLNNSYKILTTQEDGSYGSVSLHMENESEPFDYGIYFTPTPPTKRFVYDLEQLSGGEKSIASLALQYSLSLASSSPLLILDETDAFLDYGNVTRFLNLVKATERNNNIQMLIVTHKQGLFSKSDSLVGVSRPKSLNLSQVYSLRLQDN